MLFSEIAAKFELEAGRMVRFEVLEKLDSRYLFGSGYAVYKSAGIHFRIVYDGREGHTCIGVSKKHQKYPDCTWETLFTGRLEDIYDTGLKELAAYLAT